MQNCFKEKKPAKYNWVALRRLGLWSAAAFLLMAFSLIKFPDFAKMYAYALFRDAFRAGVLARTVWRPAVESEHFIVKYRPGGGSDKFARIVLETAEMYYRPVANDFGYMPKNKILIIMHPSCEDLNRVFGWPAQESAMGVYWAGVIRVVSPKALIAAADLHWAQEFYRRSGPLAHELTHLYIDYLTNGNYPRWFTEGVAQYEEYKLTGFRFKDSRGSLNQPLYSLEEMGKFDSLPNQYLAYRQSFEIVRYLVEIYGKDIINNIIKQLARGKSMDEALAINTGISTTSLEEQWEKWVVKNMQVLEKENTA